MSPSDENREPLDENPKIEEPNQEIIVDQFLTENNLVLEQPMQALGRDRLFYVPTKFDYIRINTLELIAEEIKSNNISGSVAELGVYQGDFSKYINSAFPDRTFYLFDTFEGFSQKDISIEKHNDYSLGEQDFTSTNVEMVLGKLPHPANSIVKKGYFPDSLDGLEDIFSFVYIDTDLYQPIYEGLTYFYPRLSKGGFILVHDYNNNEYKGAKAAVNNYCKQNDIPFVPISDPWGSIVIAK